MTKSPFRHFVSIGFIDITSGFIDKPNLISLPKYGILLVGKEYYHAAKGAFFPMEEKIVFCKGGG